jgi:hypothetical protein
VWPIDNEYFGPRVPWCILGRLAQPCLSCRGYFCPAVKDPQSRQAVIQLFSPATDFQGYKDVPRTLGYRFFLREGLLHMHTTMRSQDLWRGFCYDIFAATMLQELLAGWLGTGLGNYRHFADSLHLYASDVPAAQRLHAAAIPGVPMAALAAPWEEFDSLLAAVLRSDHCRTRHSRRSPPGARTCLAQR